MENIELAIRDLVEEMKGINENLLTIALDIRHIADMSERKLREGKP